MLLPKNRYSFIYRLCLSMAGWLLTGASWAQQPSITFEHLTVEDGLSAPVTHIAQDKFGFLWFGTTDGLNRFDGNNFIIYRNDPADPHSLPNNIINALHVDHEGRVWAATNGGLSYYDYADDRFHHISFNTSLEKLDHHRVHGIASSEKGYTWFATRTLIHKWKDGQEVFSIALPFSDNLLIKYLLVDPKERVWIGTNAGLYVYDNISGRFTKGDLVSPFSSENKLEVTIHPLVHYQDDTLLAGTWYADLQKVYLDINGTIVSEVFTDNTQEDPRRHIVSGLAKGAEDYWWIGTYGNGLSWFDIKKKKFVSHFQHDPSNAKSLSDDYVNDVFRDASGIVWIGTTKGLDKFDPLTQQFISVPLPLPENQFAVYRLINTIAEDRTDPDALWMCVSGAGLFHYDTKTGSFDLYRSDVDGSKDYPANNLYSFYYDRSGIIWIGSRTKLLQFDPRTKRFRPSPTEQIKKIPGVHTILQDQKGHFWFGTNSHGVHHYDPVKEKINSYTYSPENPNSIPDNKVFSLMEDHRGRIWIGTQNQGLCRLDPNTGIFLYYKHDRKDPNSIPDNGIYDLYEDKEHHIWLATENRLAVLDPVTGKCRYFSTHDGLCNNTVFSITPDHRNKLWLGTNNGLSQFDLTTHQFKNYYTNDGLPLNRVDGEIFLSSENTLFLGTTGMLTWCQPESMVMNKHIPSIIITEYSILGKQVPVMRENGMLQPIHLSHKENMITFNFAALNFSNSFLNQYAYTLEGFDEDWIYCGNNQYATYTNLNGGDYTFRVKGANNDGTWNEVGTSVLLFVHPPFWKTWWFYALCTLTVAVILYTYYKIRINQLLRLQRIRTRIARDLHDDIGSTLSSINMISSMADRNGKKTAELFHTISSASGQAMDLMSDIVWSINPKNDSMEMIIIRMRQYASETLEAAGIEFSFEVNEQGQHITLPLDIRKDFYLIFKEAINNLAKYSKASFAKIQLRISGNTIHLCITDNGIGFDPSAIISGNGLKNMTARAGQLKGVIHISSHTGQGTTIELTVPLSP